MTGKARGNRYRFAAPKGAWRSVTVTFRTETDEYARRIHAVATRELGAIGPLERWRSAPGTDGFGEWYPV